MRFNCGLSWEERYQAKQQWHRWFAWRPVRIAAGDCRWLEWVERKLTPHTNTMPSFSIWKEREYRA